MKNGKRAISQAASLLAQRSVQARKQKWGEAEFQHRLQEWGKLGGRPPKDGPVEPNKGPSNGNLSPRRRLLV
jgi:hypothetical protein